MGNLPLKTWQDIGLSDLLKGTLPGTQLQFKALALSVPAERALAELAVSVIPRNWSQITTVVERSGTK